MQKMRFYRFITIAVVSLCLISCASNVETQPPADKTNVAAPAETIAQAENLFRQRADLAKLREAVKLLGAARNMDNRNYDVEWRFARLNYFLGKQTTDAKESEAAFADGLQAGRIASRIEPNKADGFFWYGANLGEQAKRSPVTVGIKAIDEIRATLNKVIEIDPKYESASAYVGLAQIELKAGLLGGGKAEKAVELLEKALELEKNNTYIYLYLGEAYLAVGRDAEARKHLEYLLKMKPDAEYMFEYNETTARAKKLLETRF